ncbi:MAG: hypothetical protein PHF67_05255, partial [Candidatus Nanoarchaeia archaeon]|nr:hypothetical protein [Candidatus Nanoarchaeia archaeon]
MKKRFWKNSFRNKKLKFLIPIIIILVLIIIIVPSVYFVNTLQKEKIEKESGLISEKTSIDSEQLRISPEKENFFLNTLNNIFTFLETLAGIPAAEVSCVVDGDCPLGQQCGDGICVPGCLTNDQCGGGLICNGHSCVGCD